MRFYVNVNAQPTGEHEVHRANCAWLPDAENRIYLGDFYTSQAAVQKARHGAVGTYYGGAVRYRLLPAVGREEQLHVRREQGERELADVYEG